MSKWHQGHEQKSFTNHPLPSVYYLTFAARETLGSRVVELVEKEMPAKKERGQKCYRCTEIFDTESKLNSHLAIEHPECVQFQCLYCDCVLFTKGDFDEHHVELHGEYLPDFKIQTVPNVETGSEQCKICLKIIPDSFPMNIHMADQHKEDVDIRCLHCRLVCADMTELRMHHAASHQRKPVKYNVVIRERTATKQLEIHSSSTPCSPLKQSSIACPVCQAKVYSEFKLDWHLAKEHPEHVQYLCSQCGKLLAGNTSVQQHYYEQHGGIKADCSVVRNIQKHLLKSRKQEADVETATKTGCEEICSKCQSLSGEALRLHVMDVHIGYHPYSCCFCSFASVEIDPIKAHHNAVHKGNELQIKKKILKRKEELVHEKLFKIKAMKSSLSSSSSCVNFPKKATARKSTTPNLLKRKKQWD